MGEPAESRQKSGKSFMEAAQVLDRVVARFIGTKHERDIKKLQPAIAAVSVFPEQAVSHHRFRTRGMPNFIGHLRA